VCAAATDTPAPPERERRASWSSAILVAFFEWFGEFGRFCGRLARSGFAPPWERDEFARQLLEVGARSLMLVSLAGAATGVVFSLEARDSLLRFGAKPMLPTIIVLSIIKESGPIITGLIVSGRVAASIGAELAAMKVTEQLDAIEVSAVDPFRYLVATRVLACILALPLLTLAADFCGVMMGWLTTTLTDPISIRLFMHSGFARVTFNDFLPSTLKTAVFGLIIGLVACFEGMRSGGGTAGVERASARSVVNASIFIILADVVLVRLLLVFFP